MKNLERLAVLLHHRWSLPVLAALHRGPGAKFVTLVRRLGVSRDSLRTTLDALVREGWVRRNPGHGHPLRPEYVLTAQGERLAPIAARLLEVLRAGGVERPALRKWSLPVARGIAAGRGRFNALRDALPGVTPRALALALKTLTDVGLVERTVVPSYPPVARYELTPRGLALDRTVHDLVANITV